MAGQKSKRKRRNAQAQPRAVRSQRREQRAQQAAGTIRERQAEVRSVRQPGGLGERPPSPFAGLPISEIAIFAGLVGVIAGLITGGGAALIVGAIVTAIGVVEITAREHLSGFRSHTTLLAAFPAVGLELVLAQMFTGTRQRGLLLLPCVCLFGLCFWLLRKRFRSARQRRVARMPAPARSR